MKGHISSKVKIKLKLNRTILGHLSIFFMLTHIFEYFMIIFIEIKIFTMEIIFSIQILKCQICKKIEMKTRHVCQEAIKWKEKRYDEV